MVERITAASDVTSVMHSCTIPRDRCCHVIFGVTAVRHHTPLFTRAHTLLQTKHNTANTIRVGSVVSHTSMVVHSCGRKKAMTVSHHHCYYTRVHEQQRVGCSESGIVQRIIRARCACSVAHAITRKRPERNHRLKKSTQESLLIIAIAIAGQRALFMIRSRSRVQHFVSLYGY